MNGILRHRGVAEPTPESEPSPTAVPVKNPFVHSIDLTTYDRIKIAVLTVVLLPIRVVAMLLCLFSGYLLACIGTHGLTDKELSLKPMVGWRRQIRSMICWWVKNMFFSAGFRLKIKGIRASEKEAPILALAPHSSYYDALPVVVLTAPSIIVKAEVNEIPFFAKLISYTQPVYVWREDPNSRQNTIKEICRRTTSEDNWQQVLIFPEGTCSNRTSLIKFKPGAFYPGVPIQPVCIRYPNRLDTISWTWQGPGALELLWLTMTQFCTYCELEFLPVYTPSEEEKRDPHLYANNVRRIMADALKLPVVDYSYEDCRVMNLAKKMGMPANIGLIGMAKLREEFGLDHPQVESEFLRAFKQMSHPTDGVVSLEQFASHLHLPAGHDLVAQLFQRYDTDRTGTLTLRKFICGRLTLRKAMAASPSPSTTHSSWAELLVRLDLSADQRQRAAQLPASLDLPSTDEHDFLDNLYVALPEWRWIAERSAPKSE